MKLFFAFILLFIAFFPTASTKSWSHLFLYLLRNFQGFLWLNLPTTRWFIVADV